MQLNEILEENSVKAISKRTNISEENIEILLAGDFDRLKKVRMLGFISIIEREYKADLSALKEQALSHYTEHDDEESITWGLPIMEEKKGRSKLFLLFVFLLLGYAFWYFFTQFDKKQLSGLLPLNEEKASQVIMPKEADNNAALNIKNVIVSTQADATSMTESTIVIDSGNQVQKNRVNEDDNRS